MAARQPTKPAAADGFVSRKSEIATAETVPTTGSIRWKLASMMPTRSPLACGKSWPSAPPGQVAAPTFCVPALVGAVASLRGTVTGWPQKSLRARWPLASRADVPAGTGHRDSVQSRRPVRKQDH